MSATKALVRLSDNLMYGEPTPSPVNPDADLYSIVDTTLAEVPNSGTRNYRWNVKESKFYDAGLKDITGKDPTRVVLSPFTVTDNYFYRGEGFEFTAAASVQTDYDFLVTSDRAIDGSEIWLGSSVYGCKVDFQVVDVDGVLAPVGTVLNQFATNWNIHPATENSKRPGYPAKIYAGLYIRIKFTNPSANSVQVYGNLRLHEHVEVL